MAICVEILVQLFHLSQQQDLKLEKKSPTNTKQQKLGVPLKNQLVSWFCPKFSLGQSQKGVKTGETFMCILILVSLSQKSVIKLPQISTVLHQKLHPHEH